MWFQVHYFLFFNFYFYFILLYNTVLVLPYIDMNPPWLYMRSQTWTPFPPPSPQHPSGSSPCTSPTHAVSCIGHNTWIFFDKKYIWKSQAAFSRHPVATVFRYTVPISLPYSLTILVKCETIMTHLWNIILLKITLSLITHMFSQIVSYFSVTV